MRYIPNDQIEIGMTLGVPFYGQKFEVMLGRGVVLTDTFIKRLYELGYQGAYIQDEISKGLEPVDVVPHELRIKTIKAAKEILQLADRGKDAVKVKISRDHQQRIIMPLIDAVIASKKRMVDMFDLKPFEDYVYYHAANGVILSLLVGLEMGISGVELYELGMASLVHDIGNSFVPKSILNKPGALTPDEYDIIKSHAKMGFDYLYENFDISIDACMGALQHHENYDGTGYPNGTAKNKISIYGRIIAATDVYDALTSRRPFRYPVYPASAMDFMDASSGTMFDPAVLVALKRVIAMYPLGCIVELDNGDEGIVIENFPHDTARPRVRLLDGMTLLDTVLDLHADKACAGISVLEIIE